MTRPIHETVRHRLEQLEAAGYDQQFLAALETAAELCEFVARAEGPERGYLELVAIQRGLRSRLAEVARLVACSGMSRDLREHILKRANGMLASLKEIGRGRRLLVVEVSPGKPRQDLEAEMGAMLDQYYEALEKALEKAEADKTAPETAEAREP